MTFGFLYLPKEGAFEVVLRSTDTTPEGTLDEVGVQQRVVVVVFDGIIEGSVGGFELLSGLVCHTVLSAVYVAEMAVCADYAGLATIIEDFATGPLSSHGQGEVFLATVFVEEGAFVFMDIEAVLQGDFA